MTKENEYLNKIIHGDALEVLKKLPDNLVDCVVTSPPYYCYDNETECLTREGWKFIKDVSPGEMVLALDIYNEELLWANVLERFEYEYSGEMIHFKSRDVDLLVTPNHKMYVKGGSTTGPSIYLIEAKDVRKSHRSQVGHFKWRGEDNETFILPSKTLKYNKQNVKFKEIRIPMDKWLKFFGLFLAEGSVSGSKEGQEKSYEIYIKQKISNSKWIEEVLQELPFKTNRYYSKELVTFSIVHPLLYDYLKQFGNSKEKFIPQEIKNLPPGKLRILLKSYLQGDSYCSSNRTWTAHSASRRLLDDLQEIGVKVGLVPRIRGRFIHFKTYKGFKIGSFKTRREYSGKVYCLHLEKYHVFLVRRNGKILFAGNSLRFYPGTNKVWDGDPNCDHEWEYYTRPSNCWSIPSQGVYGIKGEYNKAWIREHQQAYCKKCNAWLGQLGLEPHPSLYIDHLLQIFREVKRVLKKTGVFFLNIGDTYWGGLQGFGTERESRPHLQSVLDGKYPSYYFLPPTGNKEIQDNWLQPKQLLMIPYRVASAMQEEGWILRNIICWVKVNPMPHPVKDRLVSTYEPVFMFVKNRHYYFDLDSIREKHKWASRDKRSIPGRVEHKTGKSTTGQYACSATGYHKLGKNPGDTWTIKTASFKGSHFAVFPLELVEKCLKAGCPKEVCIKCGRPKVRKYKKTEREWRDLSNEEKEFFQKTYGLTKDGKIVFRPKDSEEDRKMRERLIKASLQKIEFEGWTPTCKCNAGFRPGIVLDPFVGAGTTALVAKSLGLYYIGIELSKEYVDLANKRLQESIVNYLGG